MRTLIFVITYYYLYKWAGLGRLNNGLELPLIFPLVLMFFIMYDMYKLGWIEMENE